MKKFLFCLSFLLHLTVSYSQKQGFFNVYESEKSFCASAAVEAEDGCWIIAVYDYYGGAGELEKLSKEGVILKRTPISDEDVFSGIEGLYRDPSYPDLFYAIGHVIHWDEQITKPFVIHFDEDLNLLDRTEVDLPKAYHQFIMSRSLLTRDKDFVYATSLDALDAYHRLYMRIALDGTLKLFHEETEECGKAIMINAIFEFPESNRFGDYRSSSVYPGYTQTLVQRLFGFDDSFVFDTIHEYDNIQQMLGDTAYIVSHVSSANSTAQSLNDSVLLFSDQAFERWFNPIMGTTYFSDRSTVLFSSDLGGNIKDYLVVGSRNDTTEYPILFNAIDVEKGSTNRERQHVYHGCFGCGTIPSFSPYNIILTKTDENLNIVWQKSYTHPTRFLQATSLLATNDGGCLIVGGAFDSPNNHYDMFALKIDSEGYLNTQEVIIQDLRPYAYYPNPVQDELHLQYSPDITPKQIELYDLQGRLVHTQRNGLESLNLEGLATGTYTMRVIMEGGKVFSDKVVKE